MPSGAVVTQWQVPAVEAISRTIMVLRCLGPIKAPRAGVKGRVDGPAGSGALAWQQRNAGGHPYVHNPRLVTRPVHVPWLEEVFFFFFHEWPGR